MSEKKAAPKHQVETGSEQHRSGNADGLESSHEGTESICDDSAYRYSTCKNPKCSRPFTPLREGAQYCSSRCRIAAWRLRQRPLPEVVWLGDESKFATSSRSRNSDGTPALSNEDLAERLLEIAEEEDGGAPKTGRRFWYLALSHGYVSPDMGSSDEAKKSRYNAQKRITTILGELRKSGRLPWEAVLDLTRELDEWQTYASPREARAALRLYYEEDRWLGQPFYPILLVEKDTMEPVCKPMAQRWQMPFASSRGYSSLTLQHDVAEMLERRYAKTGQTALVYFVSDFDPSGLDLQRAWDEALSNFGVPAHFVRIGLTHAQVTAHRLDRFAIEVKKGDSRSQGFIQKYGNRCWEVDVLPADVIEKKLNIEMTGWLDPELWIRRDGEINRARKLL